ncbi:mediator of RNA polymerase II transcription subunit, putative [Entamoeba invadens IP1]|uniref:Mediator of RNA polymerase II transcription subunit 31 n=1 Tax=Entamoeba invadens IP1 TaxID=370355 RepID=A0A0A1U8Y5_ENTIV|nr:mediator of RNA polymerase II transcription subunit, putative [Entamoeba invadens IP1]ELP88448.1 mediator of RNA polymerase II transcription subunit, putative [Entamoeba invadens IP1]|eukprot:XP_004255219.1 mediator of RNA polymerase II transcription subunit, putative [Entamoeba invadens IP1]
MENIDQRPTSKLSDKTRFEYELEFIQCLANPYYLQYLAQHKQLEKPAMVHFLKYLQYWKQPNYIQFIQYPACLFYLDKLQNPDFRKACENPILMNEIIAQHEYHFAFYKTNRTPIVQRPNEEKVASSVVPN